MPEKVTEMKLKVDLQCPCCYKKVKKVLCKFPQIRDQVYDEKNNIVKIIVVSCSPEKIRDKICCKGRKVIKSIEIVVPPPPKPKEKEPEKPKQPEKPPEKPKKEPEVDPMVKTIVVKVETTKAEKPPEKPKETPKPAPAPAPAPAPPPKAPEPVPVRVSVPAYPIGVCCRECYEGHRGGPCYSGYGRPGVRCRECYEGRLGGPCYCGYGRPVPSPPCYQYGYGYNRPCYVSRCDYFSEENPSDCSIMQTSTGGNSSQGFDENGDIFILFHNVRQNQFG